jgi:DNA-binding NtrC family response regulator
MVGFYHFGSMKKVLIIEDEQYMAMILKVILTKNFDFEVKVTNGVNEGIEILQDYKPDLIITDVHLGDGKAHQMLPALNNARKNGAKIILMSGYDEISERHMIPASDIDLFLQKPFTREKIIQSLEKINFL